MSSLVVGQRPIINPPTQELFVEDNQENPQGFWIDRVVTNGIELFSSTQVRIIGSRVFAVIALIGATTVTCLAVCSIVAAPLALASIPALILAGYALWYSMQLGDYEESEMLGQLREEAQGMRLGEVVARHGWDKVFQDQILSPSQFASQYRRHVRSLGSIKDVTQYYKKVLRHVTLHNTEAARSTSFVSYSVPHPRESAYRWHREIENKTFKEIIEQYPVDEFETLGIIGHNEMQKIRELRNTYQDVQRIFQGYESEAQRIYEEETRERREALNTAKEALVRAEDTNALVEELRRLPDRQLNAEIRVRNEFGEQLRGVRDEHEQAIARLVPQGGAIIRENLSPANREEYDRLAREYFENDRRIRHAMEAQLRADRNYFEQIRRPFLERQCREIHANCERQKVELDRQFNQATEAERNARTEFLRPHQEQFDNIVQNLTLQYRAFFGQFRA